MAAERAAGLGGIVGDVLSLAFERAWAGDINGAIDIYRQALKGGDPDPRVQMCLGQLLLLQGDYIRGLPYHEKRPQADLPAPRWRGQPLSGERVLMQGEQGFGDNFQFVRYAALIAQRGGRVVVGCSPGLGKLLATVPGVSEVVEPGQGLSRPDLAVHMMSLPHVFGTRLNTIPADVPYIHADPDTANAWRRRLEGYPGLRVGLVWGGNPEVAYDWRRSPGLDPYLRLLDIPGVTFFSLQKGGAADALKGRTMPANFVDLGPELDSFDTTAAVMEGLDLVISSCTSSAHLAGALARPVWVVLSRFPDWRWLLDRDDSPWYPTARLFRAATGDDWGDVLERVSQGLRQRLA